MVGVYLAKFPISLFQLSPPSSFFSGHVCELVPFYLFMSLDQMKLRIDSFFA